MQVRSIGMALAGLAMLVPGMAQAQQQVVPMNSAPPPLPRPVVSPPPAIPPRPPQPIGSPSSWFTMEDYPSLSTFADESGTVRFRLSIDATGAVTDCFVTDSSGFDNLDLATCKLLRARARFTPGLDSAGRPVPSSYSSRFHWRLPEPAPMARTSWAITLLFTLDAGGRVTKCRQTGYGIEILAVENICPLLQTTPVAALMPLRGNSTGPVSFAVHNEHTINGVPIPAHPAMPTTGYRQVEVIQVSIDVPESGRPENCAGDIRVYADCSEYFPYLPGPDRRSVVKRITILTTGDTAVTEAAELFFR